VKTTQVVVGFQKPVDTRTLIKWLEQLYGEGTVTVGNGVANNGIPTGWIVVNNER
jgi:hypothetical protein